MKHDLAEFKPRKSKFGFRGSLNSLTILGNAEMVNRVMGPPNPTTWNLVTNTNMGASEFLVYIHDENLYNVLKAEITKNP